MVRMTNREGRWDKVGRHVAAPARRGSPIVLRNRLCLTTLTSRRAQHLAGRLGVSVRIHSGATVEAPQAPTHLLVIPKKPIVSLADLSDEDEQIMGRCLIVVNKVAAAEGLSGGYRLICNCGDEGGQEVPHLQISR